MLCGWLSAGRDQPAIIEKSIDAYNDPQRSLITDKAIKEFGLADAHQSHSITFVKVGELAKRTGDVLGWVDKYLSSQVNLAATYKQEGENKIKELDDTIAAKDSELRLAQKKLDQLKAKRVADAPPEDPAMALGVMANVQKSIEDLRNELSTYAAQKEDLASILAGYDAKVDSAKLTMFDSESVVMPILKGLETISAQSLTVHLGDKLIEMEVLVK